MAGLERLSDAMERQSAQPAKKATIAELIERQKVEIARALPAAAKMTPDRLARVALTTIKTSNKIASCTSESLLGALMTTAQLGLEPGPLGHAYFVPFKKSQKNDRGQWESWFEVQFIIGYKGILELARRSGNIRSIEARTVFENDHFDYAYGLEDRLEHRPVLKDRGDPIAYYGKALFHDGGHYFLVMSIDDVIRIRDRSKSYDKDRPSGPWHDDFDAMARKTVIRAMAPYLPLSTEMAQAFNVDETVRTSIDADALDAPPPAIEAREIDDAQPDEGLEDHRELDQTVELDLRDGVGGVDQAAESSGGAAGVEPGGDGDRLDPDALPDDVDLIEWLTSLTMPDLRELAKRYGIAAPRTLSAHALQPLAQIISDSRGAP